MGQSLERRVSRFASYCLRAIKDAKGEHAFDLAFILQRILNHQKGGWITFKIPKHIEEAIRWVLRGLDGRARARAGGLFALQDEQGCRNWDQEDFGGRWNDSSSR